MAEQGRVSVDLRALRREWADLQGDGRPMREAAFGERVRALDFLSFARDLSAVHPRDRELGILAQEAAQLEQRLIAVHERFLSGIRASIRSGECRGARLRAELDRYTAYRPGEPQEHVGYGDLDALVSGLFWPGPLPIPSRDLEPGMVPYEATPARLVLELVDRLSLAPDDVFYDLGAGLGHVALLVHLLGGVRAVGIEIEPTFCEVARRTTQDLGVRDVRFVAIDARQADYSTGTVFYLFTPFTGRILEDVLERLREQGQQRTLTLCTYGSCTQRMAAQPWLRRVSGDARSLFSLVVWESG